MFLNKSLLLIKKYNKNITQFDIDKINYGLEGVYLTITKLIIISLISVYFGCFKEFIIFAFFYNFIRLFAFGIHAANSYICLVLSSLIFILLPMLAKVIIINLTIKIFVAILCLLIICFYAPADTKKRPLVNFDKRLKFKIASIAVTILYIVLIFFSNNNFISNIVMFALLTETAMILPTTYRLFKMPYNNYKYYKQLS